MKKFYIALALFSFIFLSSAQAQNTSPFWSLAGNSNSNSVSKLGTTIAEPLNLTTNNLTRIKIYEDGRVGVGANVTNANATRVLNLVDGNAVMRILRVHPDNAPAIELLSRTSSDGANVAYWDAYAEPSDASFRIRDRIGGGAGVDRVTVKNNGFVGIGTTTPAQKLHVIGNQTLAGNLFFTSGQHSIQFANPGLAPNAMIYMLASGTTNPARMVLAHSPAFPTWGLQYSDATDRFDFLGAGTSRLSIDLGSGRIGIGNTDPGYILDVGGRMRLRTGGGSAGLWLNNNANTSEIGFIGVFDDNNIGLWGHTGAGWGFTMNTTTGDVTLRGDGRGYLFNNGQFLRDGVGTTDDIEVHGDLVPDNDGFHNLGSDALTWSTVWAVDATINTSDARFKKNIENSTYGLKEIMQLRPVTYNWKDNPDDTKRIGLIAQEVQKIIPEMVKDTRITKDHLTGKVTKVPTVRLGLQYDALIPVLTKAIQEQQQQIEQQQQQIEELKQLVNKLANGQSINTLAATGTLLQNVPNPVKGNTSIKYELPDGTSNAQLRLTDALGRTVRVVQLTASGVVDLDVSTLAAGIYNYSLVTNGKILQTKKMTVSR